MRTWIVMLVLALAGTAVAQNAAAPTAQQSSAATASGQSSSSQQKKEIKDPAEYNSYLSAVQQTNDNAKAVALEGFLQQYPNSVVKVDALEVLMATYQKMGNLDKVIDASNRLLQADPGNIRALALLSFLKRQQAEQGGPAAQQNLAAAKQYAQRGLQALSTATRPEGMSDADYQRLKTETGIIFNGTVGLADLQNKDYSGAQQYLQQSVTLNPNNLGDVYPLSLAYLQAPQPDYPKGLWYMARATSLAAQNPATQKQIYGYGRSFFVKYHGNDQGWDQLVKQAATTSTPPANLAIAPRPTPAQEAGELVKAKAVKDMTFDEFQFVLTSGNQQAADSVWGQIKDKPIAFQAKVVEATATALKLSATADDIEKNIADVSLAMVAAIPANLIPKVGSMASVEATPTSYTVQPFLITMTKGTLLTPAKPAAATGGAKKPKAAH